MRTANPALNDKTFGRALSADYSGKSMTLEGTVNKTGILLMLIIAGAAYTWNIFNIQGMGATFPWMIGGAIGGFVMALITSFNPKGAMYTAPIYALLEGLFLGGFSAYAQDMIKGQHIESVGDAPIVLQAVCLTFGILLSLLFVYRLGLIKATENFKLGVAAATGGIFMIYMVSIVMGFFGMNVPFIHESGWMGIGFSLFVVVIASLNLVLDFDFIENGAESGAPKYMEWYGAFGLVVTLVWLYIEILRLLMKLNSRR
jgi:uncharacterized YccA/Bax inhibitor family protein